MYHDLKIKHINSKIQMLTKYFMTIEHFVTLKFLINVNGLEKYTSISTEIDKQLKVAILSSGVHCIIE